MALKVHAEKRCASGRGAGDKQAPAVGIPIHAAEFGPAAYIHFISSTVLHGNEANSAGACLARRGE